MYSWRVYVKSLGYIADDFDERLVEEVVLSLSRIGALVVTVVQFFCRQETKCWHCQKLYTDIFEASQKLAAAQLVGPIRQF